MSYSLIIYQIIEALLRMLWSSSCCAVLRGHYCAAPSGASSNEPWSISGSQSFKGMQLSQPLFRWEN